jgi:hypothetical protein
MTQLCAATENCRRTLNKGTAMTLYESIALEIKEGVLDAVFKAQDLLSDERKVLRTVDGKQVEKYRIGFEFFKENGIRPAIADYAVDKLTGDGGYAVRNGAKAKYLRTDSATYQLLPAETQDEGLPAL